MRRTRVFVMLLSAAAGACYGRPAPDQAQSPTAPAAVEQMPLRTNPEVRVTMQDGCDPETFNAVFGDGTCTRGGGVTLDDFLETLRKFGAIGPWRNAPAVANVIEGQTIVAVNRGGEVHTFTQVANFGGGVVPLLNDLAHVPDVAPECRALTGEDFVAPDGTHRETVDRKGTVKFQCCIHPWMRMEASSR